MRLVNIKVFILQQAAKVTNMGQKFRFSEIATAVAT